MVQFHTSEVKSFLQHSYAKPKRGTQIAGYKRDDSLSGQRAQVYTNAEGKAVVVHRGTSGIHDMLTDAQLSLGYGKHSARVEHAKKIQKQAETKYGAGNTTTMGHSLGGHLAEKVASKDSKVITLNKAALPKDIGKKIKSNQTDIRTKGDLVSMLGIKQKGGKRVTIKSTSSNPLKEHTLNVLDRVDKKV